MTDGIGVLLLLSNTVFKIVEKLQCLSIHSFTYYDLSFLPPSLPPSLPSFFLSFPPFFQSCVCVEKEYLQRSEEGIKSLGVRVTDSV